MKTIIAGSRCLTDYNHVVSAVEKSGYTISELVSGGARGIDALGERYAEIKNIPIKQFLPDWKKYGKSAGMLRNVAMAEYAEALIAVWDGQSRGTAHMILAAKQRGLHICIYNP